MMGTPADNRFYRTKQMHSKCQGRSVTLCECEDCDELLQAHAKIAKLRAVLGWYADLNRTIEQLAFDDGVRAREALKD